jgi:hypothetical protein
MLWCGSRTAVVGRPVRVACIALMLVSALANRARADVASDQAAAILVFPKILVDASAPPQTKRGPIDTLIRVSNTSDRPIAMSCFYINGNGHCHSSPGTICDPYDRSAPNGCGGSDFCEAGWHETDFTVTLSPRQPIAWLASVGAAPCDSSAPGLPCFPLVVGGQPPNLIQPVSEDPFIGELKCVAVDFSGVPVARNDLKGEAEIIRSSAAPDLLDVEAYNAIGIPAILGNNDGDTTLVLGGGLCNGGSRPGSTCGSLGDCPGGGRCSAEYSGCPNILILDHFFDGAIDPVSRKVVTTTLTLVPCSEDFELQSPVRVTVQVLVFNEFEQRFSTSTPNPVTCFREFKLTDIDGSTPDRSIFSAAVMGTLTGQTRLRGVAGADSRYGYTLLGVAEEFRNGGGTAAFNLHFNGSRPDSDYVYLPH